MPSIPLSWLRKYSLKYLNPLYTNQKIFTKIEFDLHSPEVLQIWAAQGAVEHCIAPRLRPNATTDMPAAVGRTAVGASGAARTEYRDGDRRVQPQHRHAAASTDLGPLGLAYRGSHENGSATSAP